MGKRCFLFLYEQGQHEVGFEQCIDEADDRLALEWMAWLPDVALDAHIAALRRHREFFAARSTSDDDLPAEVNEACAIIVPYPQADAALRQVLARTLNAHPQLGPDLLRLRREMERRVGKLKSPALRFELLQMADLTAIDDYANNVTRQRAFWLGHIPWEQVARTSAIEVSLRCRHPSGAQRRLHAQAFGPSRHPDGGWLQRHENLSSWLLGLLSALVFLYVLHQTHSVWRALVAFLGAAGLLGYLLTRKPARRVINSPAAQQLQHLPDVPSANPLPGEEMLRRHPPYQADNALSWDENSLTATLWAGGRLSIDWQDIDSIGYTLDDGASDAWTVWDMSLTKEAENKEAYRTLEVPLWFCFEKTLSPGVQLSCLYLLQQTYGRSITPPA